MVQRKVPATGSQVERVKEAKLRAEAAHEQARELEEQMHDVENTLHETEELAAKIHRKISRLGVTPRTKQR